MKKNLVSFACILVEAAMIFGLFQSFGRIPAAKAAASSGTDAGVIAYVRSVNGREDQIRMVNPDGGSDHAVWSTGDMGVETDLEFVNGLVWRPDGTELGFQSSHEASCSFYGSDIYAIRPDGSHYRRVVRPPACGQNPGSPTGTVEVTYYNLTGYLGPFVLYIEGAPAPQHSVIPNEGSVTVTFNNVVDFGDSKLQWATAIFGQDRFMSIEGKADVKPGGTVKVEVFMSYAFDFAYNSPTWNYDGTDIAYTLGSTIYHMATDLTAPGDEGLRLLNPAGSSVPTPIGASFLAYGPTQALAGKLLYTGWNAGDNIYMATAGQDEPGEILVTDGQVNGSGFLGLTWLPDGSGFLFSMGENFAESANIFRYYLATGHITRLTDYTSTWTHRMSISPDGKQVVYELQTGGSSPFYGDQPKDLYIMNLDGSNQRLLVEDGRSPAWGLPQQVTDNPVPELAALDPSSANAGGAGFTLTISGSNFMDGSVVRWNNVSLPTSYLNATTLTAQVPAAQIASAGMVPVTVINPAPGGGVSAALSFAINQGSQNEAHKIFLPLLVR